MGGVHKRQTASPVRLKVHRPKAVAKAEEALSAETQRKNEREVKLSGLGPNQLMIQFNYKRIARWILLGKTQAEIAKHLGLTPISIRKAVERPKFRTYLLALEQDYLGSADRRLKNSFVHAVDTLLKWIKHADPTVSLRAIEILMRTQGRLIESLMVRFEGNPLIDARTQVMVNGQALGDGLTRDEVNVAKQLLERVRASVVKSDSILPPILQLRPQPQLEYGDS